MRKTLVADDNRTIAFGGAPLSAYPPLAGSWFVQLVGPVAHDVGSGIDKLKLMSNSSLPNNSGFLAGWTHP